MPQSLIDPDGKRIGEKNPLSTRLGSNPQSVTIANGESLSSVIDKRGKAIGGIQAPAALDAAALTFQGSMDNSTFVEIADQAGNALTTAGTLSASGGMSLDLLALALAPWPYIKIRTGTSGSPQAQSAARTLLVDFV
jgi:hypothetical protein